MEESLEFHQMGLNDRLLSAIADLQWGRPTPIQEKAIPFGIEGKDILARARTGSGKTGAYAVPMIQKILEAKQVSNQAMTRALVLAPTKELCTQAARNIKDLSSHCTRVVRCLNLAEQLAIKNMKPLLNEKPDILVGTPTRILENVKAGMINLKDSLEVLVIDEADLIFSCGYEENLKELLGYLPKIHQSYLMSATFSEDVKALKSLVLHNPVILKLDDSQLADSSQLSQYYLKCVEEDKFLLIYTLLKLRLILGKSIIFVNTVDRCYKLKLFLELFGIQSCILNSELPVNSRCAIVSSFNEGEYDLIIAADESSLANPGSTKGATAKKRKKDQESGISRGIDFQYVSTVVNFDFPPDVNSYIHRVGRTARGDNEGTALTFVNPKETEIFEELEEVMKSAYTDGENPLQKFNFRMEEIEGFRYRAKEAMLKVTKLAVREARLKEIRSEMLNSTKLKSYFEDNPRDLQLIRHDKPLHKGKKQPHMKNVPEYLVPPSLKTYQPTTSSSKIHHEHEKYKKKAAKGQRSFRKRKGDPLKSFTLNKRSKKR